MNRLMTRFSVLVLASPLLGGCSYLPARVLIHGTVQPVGVPVVQVYSNPLSITVSGLPTLQDLQEGEVICTEQPLKLHIMQGFQNYYVVFGPNPGQLEACGFVTFSPATFHLSGSAVFFWGRMPRPHTERIVARVPSTTGFLRTVKIAGVVEDQFYLVGPSTAEALLKCEAKKSSTTVNPSNPADPPVEYERVLEIRDGVTEAFIDCDFDTLAPTAADLAEYNRWRDIAIAAGWNPADP